MDERKLAELLQDVVADTPPPSFDQHDVARASERQRIRRRNGILTGSAFGVVGLASATALSVALWTGPQSAEQTSGADSAAAGGNAGAGPYELPQEGAADSPKSEREDAPMNAPSEPRKQGRHPSGEAGPESPGSTPSGCEQADRELAAALAGELPAAASYDRDAPKSVELRCPDGAKGAAFPVREGERDGTVSVVLMSADGPQAAWSLPDGADLGEAQTANDDTVVVISVPASGKDAPLAGDLDTIAAGVAEQY